MNIYVGNLPRELENSDLKVLFEQYGTVDNARVIRDRETGNCRGFGFVEMGDREEAETAIRELNGSMFKGRSIRVNEARERRSKFRQRRRERRY